MLCYRSGLISTLIGERSVTQRWEVGYKEKLEVSDVTNKVYEKLPCDYAHEQL